jgi:membrane protein implicated in regulation of membrane protease activity
MSTVAGTFLVIGGFALLLLVLSLVGGGRTHVGRVHLGRLHVGRLHLGRIHLGRIRVGRIRVGRVHGHAGDGGTDLSLPMVAGFLGAFGFGGAIVASLLPGRGATTLLAAVLVGLLAAVPTAWLAGRLVNAAMNMSTDATLSSGDLIGAMGVVITPVPVGGYGEVRLAVAGQYIKFNARSDEPLALGTQIFVISVPSPTSVLVEPIASL